MVFHRPFPNYSGVRRIFLGKIGKNPLKVSHKTLAGPGTLKSEMDSMPFYADNWFERIIAHGAPKDENFYTLSA
jgi:hypothetical protein